MVRGPRALNAGRHSRVVRVVRLPGIHHDSVCTIVHGSEGTVLVDTGTCWYQANLEERIRAQLSAMGSSGLDAIVVTHRHFDSAGAAAYLSAALDAPVMAHDEALSSMSSNDLLTTWASRYGSDMPFTEIVPIMDGWSYNLGEGRLVALHTPGHTSCHISIHLPEKSLLIAGDLLPAAGHPARWDLPTGNLPDMISSLERLAALNVETAVTSRGESIKGVDEVKDVFSRHIGFMEERLIALGSSPEGWPKPGQTCMYWTPEPPWE